jgi:hypothetical protein
MVVIVVLRVVCGKFLLGIPFRTAENSKFEVMLRPIVSRPVLVSGNHLGPMTEFLLYCSQTVTGLLMWGALSDERAKLLLVLASKSRIRVPRDSRPYFTVLHSRLLQPGGPGPRIYFPQEHGCLVVPPGTGFPFRRLLRPAGLRWRYSTRVHTGFGTKFVQCELLVMWCGLSVHITLRWPKGRIGTCAGWE